MFDKRRLDEMKREEEMWESTLTKALQKRPEREEEFTSVSGQTIKRLYTPTDVENLDYARDLGFPGEYPFARGIYPTMYRGRLWTMSQYSGFGTAEETNRRLKYLIEQGGAAAAFFALDLPTQIGYGSDNPLVKDEVGKVGVAIDSIEDLEVLFDGIPLDKVAAITAINAPAAVFLAMYIALAEKRRISIDKLSGTFQNDILKEFISRGMFIFPIDPSMKLATDVIEFCSKNMPQWNLISVCGYHIREAGSTAAQEIAFAFSDAIAYIEHALERGLKIDDFAPRITFNFATSMDFFEEIAKYRAARRLWAKIIKERYRPQNPRSMWLRTGAGSAGSTLTAQQPFNNIVRVTLQTLASVLGGVQQFHAASMDEALSIPTEESVRTALRTEQIIAYESGVANTIDPLGGSFFIENLTDKMEKDILNIIEQIDAMGGMLKAIEKGWVHKEISDASYRYQRELEKGKRIVVGVNQFVTKEETKIELFKTDPLIQKRQEERLRELKERRDNDKVEEALQELKAAAIKAENLMPVLIRAAKVYATIGEMCDVLREVYGEYEEQHIL